MKFSLITAAALIAFSVGNVNAAEGPEITLEQIMADPDWIGNRARNFYWGDDSQSVYYYQKRLGSKPSDLFVHNFGGAEGQKVPLEALHQYSDRDAVLNDADTHEAYIYEDNVFIKKLSSGMVTQVSHNSIKQSQPAFLIDGRLSYRSGPVFMVYDPATVASREIANLLTIDDPEDEEEPTYLAAEQRKLIDFIDKKITDEDNAKAEKKELIKANPSLAPEPFYFGKDNEIKNAVLSPAGDKMIVVVTKKVEKDEKDIMATFISESGNIEPTSVRRRVADQEPVNHTVFLVDLADNSKSELTYDSLPDFDKDVLRSVREENHKRRDEDYKSEKKAG